MRSVFVVGSKEQNGTLGVSSGEAPTRWRKGQEDGPGNPAHASSTGAGPSESLCSRSCTRGARGGQRQGVVWRGSWARRARGAGRRGTVGARAFVCAPLRSPPPGAWCLAHLTYLKLSSLSGAECGGGCAYRLIRGLSLGSNSLKQSMR